MNALNPPEARDTTCPECGMDHGDGANARLERRYNALRVENAALMLQRDALLGAVDWRTLELMAHELESPTAPIKQIIESLRGRAAAERAAVEAVRGAP